MVVILDRYCTSHGELCDLIDDYKKEDLKEEEDWDEEVDEDSELYAKLNGINEEDEFNRQPDQLEYGVRQSEKVEQPKQETDPMDQQPGEDYRSYVSRKGRGTPYVTQRPGEDYRSYVARKVREVEAVRRQRRGF